MSEDVFGGIPGHVWVARQRTIHEPDYLKTICDWLKANGINPADVPVDPHVTVADGQLTIPLRVRDENGKHVLDPSTDSLVTETVTVPVRVKPDSDVELWLMPRCECCGR